MLTHSLRRLFVPALLFSLFIPLFLSACDDEVAAPPDTDEPTMEEIRSAPTTLDITSVDPSVDVSMWRNFFPISAPPGGGPLTLVVRLRSTPDDSPFPSGVGLRHVWVINGWNVWTATPSVNRQGELIEGYANDGPKWDVGIKVDVVLGITVDGSLRLFRIPAQTIHGAY